MNKPAAFKPVVDGRVGPGCCRGIARRIGWLTAFVILVSGFPIAHATDAPVQSSARPRASLLPLVGPIWSSLSPAQKEVLAPFESQWNSWTLEEKRAWVRVADRFPKLEPALQESLRQRVLEWAALSVEQRRMARQNYRIVRTVPKEELADDVRRYQELTPEQRRVLEENGSTSNTAARHAGSRTGLAKQASQPISGLGVERSNNAR